MSMWQRATGPFGDVTGEALSYLDNTFQAQTSSLTGVFAELVFKAQNEVRTHRAFKFAVAAGRKLRYAGRTNEVRQLFDIGEMQQATEIQQSLLVAMPEYRTLYNDNMAEGYADGFSIYDHFRGSAHMLTDFNFRAATNGLSNKYDEDGIWNFTTPVHAVGMLSKADQVDTMGIWARMHRLDWDESDPCSEMNSACG